MSGTAKDHQSRAQSESRLYEQMRESGIGADAARKASREASETVHRNADRVHTDTPRPPRKG